MPSVPLVDETNPLYCSNIILSSSGGSPDFSDANLSLSAFLRKLTGRLNPQLDHQKMDTTNSNAIEQTIVHDRAQAQDHVPETPPARSGFADQASSPCGRFLSSLDGSGPARKRARHTETESPDSDEPSSMPDSEWERLCEIMRQSPPPPQDERTREVFEGDRDQRDQVSEEGNIEGRVYTRTLLLRLDEIFPGKGFREATESHAFAHETVQDFPVHHQGIVDLLGERGVLNEKALTALRDAEFRQLDLGPTMAGINGLMFPRGNVMHVLSKAGWFKHLEALSFAGGRFQDDFDLVYIQPLRQLEKLVLSNTGIGNEGVFHIVGLKYNLQHLDLSGNPLIDDDVVPAFIILENLRYLSIIGTSVTMHGLRKLAGAMKESERVFDIELPSVCKKYMDDLHTHYLLQPAPPLISDPSTCSMLSKLALSSNLAAHAVINPAIVSNGTRKELQERLMRLLETRRLDLVVREILCRETAKDEKV